MPPIPPKKTAVETEEDTGLEPIPGTDDSISGLMEAATGSEVELVFRVYRKTPDQPRAFCADFPVEGFSPENVGRRCGGGTFLVQLVDKKAQRTIKGKMGILVIDPSIKSEPPAWEKPTGAPAGEFVTKADLAALVVQLQTALAPKETFSLKDAMMMQTETLKAFAGRPSEGINNSLLTQIQALQNQVMEMANRKGNSSGDVDAMTKALDLLKKLREFNADGGGGDEGGGESRGWLDELVRPLVRSAGPKLLEAIAGTGGEVKALPNGNHTPTPAAAPAAQEETRGEKIIRVLLDESKKNTDTEQAAEELESAVTGKEWRELGEAFQKHSWFTDIFGAHQVGATGGNWLVRFRQSLLDLSGLEPEPAPKPAAKPAPKKRAMR